MTRLSLCSRRLPPREPGRASSCGQVHHPWAITLGYYAHFVPEAGGKGRGTVDGLLRERGGRLVGRDSRILPGAADR